MKLSFFNRQDLMLITTPEQQPQIRLYLPYNNGKLSSTYTVIADEKDLIENNLDLTLIATQKFSLHYTEKHFSFQVVKDENGKLNVFFFDSESPSIKNIVDFSIIQQMLKNEDLAKKYCEIITKS